MTNAVGRARQHDIDNRTLRGEPSTVIGTWGHHWCPYCEKIHCVTNDTDGEHAIRLRSAIMREYT